MSFFPLKVAEIDSSRRPFMYKLKDLLGDKIPGRYYAEQLRIAPRPGIDFKLEVRNNFDYLTMSSMQVPVIEKPITRRQKAALKRKMTFVVYLNLDCFTECDELVFVFKCLTVAVIILCLAVIFRLLSKLT